MECGRRPAPPLLLVPDVEATARYAGDTAAIWPPILRIANHRACPGSHNPYTKG